MYYTITYSVCAVFIQAVLLCCRGANVNVAFITIYAIIYVCTCYFGQDLYIWLHNLSLVELMYQIILSCIAYILVRPTSNN